MSEESTLYGLGTRQNGNGLGMEQGARGTEKVLLTGSFTGQAIEQAALAVGIPERDWTAFQAALVKQRKKHDPSSHNGVEIEGLPRAPMIPIRDMVLAQRVKQEKIGSIFVPDGGLESQKCRVLAVGPGLLLDDGVIRPAPCRRGETIFTTPKDGFLVVLNGEEFWIFEACEVVALILDESASAYGTETCLNE